VGKVKAIEIKAAIEIGKRFIRHEAKPEDIIQKSEDVFEKYRLNFTDVKQETFRMLILTSRNQVLKEVKISMGSLTSSTVHPREVFREAIRESASGVVFVHNHPSGDPTPSRTDILMTERLKSSGEILGIRVLDHIIIGENTYYSFADQGLL
jgi:DNA repair protein RadC